MLMEDKRAWDLMPGHYKYTNTVYLEKGQKKNSLLFFNFQNGELAVGLHCL